MRIDAGAIAVNVGCSADIGNTPVDAWKTSVVGLNFDQGSRTIEHEHLHKKLVIRKHTTVDSVIRAAVATNGEVASVSASAHLCRER